MTPVPVDTLQHGFQNSNDTGGPTGHYTYLGNLGAPRISHVFFERKESSQFFFTDPYDFTVRKPSDVVYTNTKSPFTNLTYFKQGDGRYGEERFKAYFAVNVNKRMASDSTSTTLTAEENTTASLRHYSTVTSLPTTTATSTICTSALSMKT